MLGHPDVSQHVRDRVTVISDEASRAARIVQNLLRFARQYTTERRPCSLVEQARRVLELNAYQLQTDHIRVVTDLATVPHVLGDESGLQQVLLNLVRNAQQEMVKQRGSRVLTVRTFAAGPRVCVEVRDTGPGIADEVLPRIFDPFFTTKPPGEGSGLGLSVSYGIVAELGGTLRAQNHPDGGASFVLELPAANMA